MLRLFRFLFTGDWHMHNWQTLEKVTCSDPDGGRWYRYYCKCTVCGKHKKFD